MIKVWDYFWIASTLMFRPGCNLPPGQMGQIPIRLWPTLNAHSVCRMTSRRFSALLCKHAAFLKMSLMCFYFEYEHVNKAAVSELGYLLTEQLEGVFSRT